MAEIKTKEEGGANYRLPEDVKPSHYSLVIKTDLEVDPPTFEGTAEIDIDILKDTNKVVFHAASPLKVISVALSSTALKTSSREEPTDVSFDKKFDRCTATFASKLVAGTKAKLGVRFEGVLDGSMMGYYKSTYEFEGHKGSYGLTQFEPTAARKAFPCWDEPAIKATVDVSLLSRRSTVSPRQHFPLSTVPHPPHVPATDLLPATSASSEKGPSAKTEKGPSGASEDWELTKYETTPKISTYLVAWANGRFVAKEGSCVSPLTGKKIPLRVFATPEHAHQTGLLLQATEQILPVYEKIFDIPYPLSKMDTLVASDFDAGAMENWGLITCRTSVGLWDESSGLSAKKYVVAVQAHELAHQWFGNIVTMFWWEELWLNEAFATLMGEVISIAAIHPEWNPHASFIGDHLGRALSLDARRSSHPIQVPCPDPEMINRTQKGASVLKMLSNLVGEETFLRGVSLYLKAHLYGNGTTKDLWAGISEASGLDIEKIMDSWTLKIGFPMITVEETADGLKVKQNRFLSTGDPTPAEDETLWYVPLQLKTISKDGKVSTNAEAILETRDATLPLPENVGYKLNAETCGVYRVRYPAERLAKLGVEAARADSAFTMNDKIGLIQDAFVLGSSGYGSSSSALDLVEPMGEEKEYMVWAEIIGGIFEINKTWWEQPEEVREALAKFSRTLFGPLAGRVGFDTAKGDSEDTVELRVKAITAAADCEDPKTIEEVKRRFGLFVEKDDDLQISGDLRKVIWKNGVKFGGEKEYEKVVAAYHAPATPEHKIAAMGAMCATRDPALLKRTFDFLLSGNVKEQDFSYFFRGLSSNSKSRRDMWEFTKSNFDELMKRFTGNFSLGRLIMISFDSFTTTKDADEVETFFKDKDVATFKASLAQGLDSVRARAAWLDRDTEELTLWLKQKQHL